MLDKQHANGLKGRESWLPITWGCNTCINRKITKTIRGVAYQTICGGQRVSAHMSQRSENFPFPLPSNFD